MHTPTPRSRPGTALFLLTVAAHAPLAAQAITVPLATSAWEATDSLRVGTYLGREALYIDRGVALARDIAVENGTIEYDVATVPTTSFLGLAFRARSPRFSEILMLRPRASGTIESMQYAPAFNNIGAAWQVYHGPESNAIITFPREQWVHVRLELDGIIARVYFDTATTPTLTVPRLAGAGGTRIGVWTGAFGHGGWFSNIRYTVSNKPGVATPATLELGVIADWELSNLVEPTAFTPKVLPDLTRLTWEHVKVEAAGFVLVSRYREQPHASTPTDPKTQAVLVDSVMTGKIAGSKIVYARTTIQSARAEIRRLHFCYSDGVVIYLNGQPLAFAMNPSGFRDELGVMNRVGDAVYLPLKAGRNELVFASIEVGAGWAFGAKLDPP